MKGKRILEFTVFDGTEKTLPQYCGCYLIESKTESPYYSPDGCIRLTPAYYHSGSRVFVLWHKCSEKDKEAFRLDDVQALVAGDRWCEIPRSFDEDTEGDL